MKDKSETARAFVLANVDIGMEREVIDALKSISEVKEAFRIYGVYDTLVKLESNDRVRLNEAVITIRRLEGIRNTMTLLPLEGFEK